MAKENNLKEALLRQMNENSNMTSGLEAGSAHQVIARDTAAVKRGKKVATFAWMVLLIFLFVVAVIEFASGGRPDWLTPAAIVVFQALLIIAVICSVSLYVRSRTLGIHKIQASLTSIEELLKKMSADKQPPDKT
jgi:prepilin signal peptidase PulO-like enzyme (type II secretory pathway)